VDLPPGQELLGARSPSIALSPDGRYLVYAARTGGTSQLHVRPLDRFESTPIPGTEGGRSPFFSPDGAWVAFFTTDRLKKVPREGGSPVTICETLEEGHGSWGPDGQIVFGYGRVRVSGLWQVPAAGGTPVALTSPETFTGDEWGHGAPHILPNQKVIIFSSRAPPGPRLRALSRADGVVRDLQLGGTGGSPSWASTGHLVYGGAGGRLVAVPFDDERLEPRGSARPLAERTAIDMVLGIAQFALSDNGTLAYIPGQSRNQLLWVDRKGVTTPVDSRLDVHLTPRLSPDGQKLAVAVFDEGVGRRSIWVLDLERGARTRLTFADGQATDPVWLRDGRLAYGFAPDKSPLGVFVKSADGSGEAVELFAPELQTMPSFISNDGRLLVFYQAGLTGGDLGVIHLDEDREPTMLMTTPHEEIQPALSPDSRWLAYTSNETGRREVYVTSFPDLEGKWQVSSGGGYEALWAPRRPELYYRTEDAVKILSFTTEPGFTPSTPSVLFEGSYAVDPFSADAHNWSISPDGERFLMISQQTPRQINVVLNWFDELERLVPAD
jgi:serine/threonine-protein kinase